MKLEVLCPKCNRKYTTTESARKHVRKCVSDPLFRGRAPREDTIGSS